MTDETNKPDNEFDNLGLEDLDEVEIPADDGMGDFSNTTTDNSSVNDNISGGSSSEAYDWNKAPEEARRPPRVDLDGKTITVVKADILLPSKSVDWITSRKNKDTKYKSCIFKLTYDVGGQQENYSGVNVFRRDGDMYSHPTIARQAGPRGFTQATQLLEHYAKYKGKDINEISLKEFMFFLNSKPKALIVAQEFENPDTGDKVKKNMIGSFVN